MSGPSTSSERSTVLQGDQHHHDSGASRPDYDSVTATAAAAVNASGYGSGLGDEANQFHPHHSNSYATAAEFQHRAELQRRQQQLQQQELHHQQQLQQFQQQQQQQHQQQQHQQHQHQQLQQQQQQQVLQQHHHQLQHAQHGLPEDYDNGGILGSRFIENEIIKTFSSKAYLVKYVKDVLSAEERCKIVINSSKPKAVYFQCERSGSFRTTVKDSTKRQRVAYTKRNKCGYRLVANLYPPEKEKKKIKKQDSIDDKLSEFPSDPLSPSNEMWILRMINPAHNHAPEPINGKKKRSKNARTLVEKPIHRNVGSAAVAAAAHYVQNDVQLGHNGLHHHHQLHHDDGHTPSVQDAAVIAAIEATPAAAAAAAAALHNQHTPVDPNIDPNVDPSVSAHDHAHLRQYHPGLRR